MSDKQVYKDQMEVACQKCWNAHCLELEKAGVAYGKLLNEMVSLEAEINLLKEEQK
jgi:hypothetical protein